MAELREAGALLPDGTYFDNWETEAIYDREYHVDSMSPDASDDNDGSEAAPFKTIQAAADKAVAKELLNTYRIEFAAVTKRRVANLAVLVAVYFRVLSAQRLQFVEHLSAAPHLLHGVRTKQVEVNLV